MSDFYDKLKQLRYEEHWVRLIEMGSAWLHQNTPNDSVLAEVAFALANVGQLEQAEAYAKQALHMSSGTSVLSVRALVFVALQCKNVDIAIQFARKVFQPPFVFSGPEEAAQAILTLAVAHNANNEKEISLSLVQESLKVHVLDKALSLKAALLFETKNFEGAIEAARVCIECAPHRNEAWHLLGTSLYNLNRVDEVIQTYEKMVNCFPSDVNALSTLGELYSRINRSERAEIIFHKTLEIDPTHVGAWTNLSKLYYHQHRPKECLHAIQMALHANPNQPELLANLALLYFKAQQDEEAGKLLERAYELAPCNDKITLELAAYYEQKQRSEHADALVAQVVARNPDAPFVLMARANLDKMRGNYCEAMLLVQQALSNELWFLKQQPTLSLFGDAAPPYMDVYDASSVLLDACAFLESINVPYFLIGGTLLGILRDGELLPHDKDIDFGIPWDVDREWLMGQIEQSELFAMNGSVRPSTEVSKWNFSFVRKGTPIAVDLFFYLPEEDYWLQGFHALPSPWLVKYRQRKMSTISYRGKQLVIPESPEEVMAEVFGAEWKQPDPYFDTILSAYNLHDSSFQTAKIIGFDRLYEKLKDRSWNKVYKYCHALKRFGNEPVLDELADWLRGACPELANMHKREAS